MNRKSLLSLLAIPVFSVATTLKSFAQKDSTSWKPNSISFVTGETALTKGNTLSGVFSKQKSVLLTDFNKELGEFLYFYSPIKQASVGASGGIFKNTLWFGPIASLNLLKGHVKTLNWVGWSLGDPEKGSTTTNPLFCFSYHQITGSYKGFEGYYAHQKYQSNPPEHTFGIKARSKLTDNISTLFGAGYMLHADKFLWSTGITYNFK